MPSYTSKLNLKLIDEKEYFADEAFNNVINDADDKLVGVSHLSSAQHWDEWKPNKAYSIGDIVRYKALLGGQYVKCVVAGISGSSEPTSNVTGSNVKDGTVEWSVLSLADLLFDSTKIDIWLSSSNYKRGQVALYNNCLYRCKTPHTSSSSFDLDASLWQEVKASIGLWKPLVYYYVDDIVVNDGLIYKNNVAHVSDSTFSSTEEANWELIGGAGGISSWQSSETYNEGQLVINDGIVYRVNSKHTSSSSFSADIANWDILNAGLNDWATSVYYPVGIVVLANNKIYQCKSAHTSTTFTADIANWQEISGYRIVIDDWKANTGYVVGDLCANDKKIYRCTIKHTSGTLFDNTEKANWEELSPTINEINDWKSNTSYNAKDIVINDNALYRCKTAHTSTSSFATDALTYWDKLSGANSVGVWASGKSYDAGQLVVYNNQLFRANVSHASSATFDLDGAKWNLLESNIGEYKANVYYPIGTSVIYNNALFKCKVAHNSTSTFNRDNWTRIDSNNPLVKDWATSTYYYANDVVLYANQLYRCKTNHTSSNFSADKTNWTLLRSGDITFRPNIYYYAGDIVEYNGNFYKCRYSNSYTNFSQIHWEKISRTVETWKPCYYSDSLISLITFTPDTYIKGSTSDGALAFTDLNHAVEYYFYEGGSPDSHLYYYDDGGYDGNYVHLTRASGALTTSSLGVYKDARDFTMDFFVSNASYTVSMFGVNVALSSTVTADWHYALIQYNSTSNTADAWMDGVYAGNFALGNATTISLTGANASFDNLRFTNNILYTTTDSVPIPPTSVYELGNNYRYYTYNTGDFVEYEGVLYRCLTNDSDTVFVPKKWQQVANIVLTWTPNVYYFVGQLVMDGQTLLRCVEAHTSGADLDNAEYAKWEIIADNKILIKDWETNKKYYADNVVFSDNILYRCTANHTSGSFTTDLSDGYWVKVSGGGSGSGTSNYSQMVLMNITAPKTYEIKIAETTDFCFPPVEVLKFKAGQTDVVVDALTFDLSDGKLFEVDGISSENSPYALFKDGRLYLATEYEYKHGSATSCGNGYVTMSDEIDLSNFKSVESVEVV